MSVLIKGIDMPSGLAERGFVIRGDGRVCNFIGTPIEGCCAVEVPTPHGRLIDADDLHEKMYHEAFEVDSEMQRWDGGCWIRYKVFENCESDCPTVIESEE